MSSRQSKVGVIAWAAAVVPFILACASDTPTNTRSAPSTDASTGGSSSRGSGGRATGGAPSAGDTGGAGAGGIRSSGGAAGADASLTAGGAGAGSGAGGTGGFGARPEVDAGPEPPPYCVAPCVWEVVKHCMPLMRQCAVEPIGQGLGTLTCDTTTGWSSRYELVSPRTYRTTLAWHGTTCVSWVTSYVLSTMGSTSLYDASGNPVALMMDGTTYCGAQFSDFTNLGNAITDSGLAYGDGRVLPAVHLQRSKPECAAWGAFGFPAREICQSVDAGTCQ